MSKNSKAVEVSERGPAPAGEDEGLMIPAARDSFTYSSMAFRSCLKENIMSSWEEKNMEVDSTVLGSMRALTLALLVRRMDDGSGSSGTVLEAVLKQYERQLLPQEMTGRPLNMRVV